MKTKILLLLVLLANLSTALGQVVTPKIVLCTQTNNAIHLEWTTPNENVEAFYLSRAAIPHAPPYLRTIKLSRLTVRFDAKDLMYHWGFDDTAIDTSTTYDFGVLSMGYDSWSLWSNTVKITTPSKLK